MKVRPRVGALLAAGLAVRLQIGEPLLVRPWVCAYRDRVVAMKVRAIDQETAHAEGSHFAIRDLPRAGHAPPLKSRHKARQGRDLGDVPGSSVPSGGGR